MTERTRLRDHRRRPLPRAEQARLGRHGRRLLRRGPPARARGRAQGAAQPLRRRPRVRRALPPRGVERRRPAAPARRLRLRPRQLGRHLLHRDGVPARALAQAGRPAARAAHARGRDRPHDPGPARRPLRPPPRDHPPRPQAPQRDRRRRGPRQGHRLRHRARRRLGHDADRLDHGHGAVPVARAGPGPPGRASAPTSTRSGSSSTSCSPAASRSRARARSRSPSSRSTSTRRRRARSTPRSRRRSRPSSCARWRRTRRAASPTPTRSSPRSSTPAPGAARRAAPPTGETGRAGPRRGAASPRRWWIWSLVVLAARRPRDRRRRAAARRRRHEARCPTSSAPTRVRRDAAAPGRLLRPTPMQQTSEQPAGRGDRLRPVARRARPRRARPSCSPSPAGRARQSVPAVEGLSRRPRAHAPARRRLRDRASASESSDDIPDGRAIRTSPPEGAEQREGRARSRCCSRPAPSRSRCPTSSGDSFDEAEPTLEARRLRRQPPRPGHRRRGARHRAQAEPGRAAQAVDKGSTVTLVGGQGAADGRGARRDRRDAERRGPAPVAGRLRDRHPGPRGRLARRRRRRRRAGPGRRAAPSAARR